jgi:hypothetical protein
VWWEKLAFYEVGNGDLMAIDLRPETYDYLRQHSAQLREHALGQTTASRIAWLARLQEALRSGEHVLRAYER